MRLYKKFMPDQDGTNFYSVGDMEKLPEYRMLEPFVGEWKTEGVILPTEVSDEQMLHGRDTYAWLPGGHFMLHRVDVWMGAERNETLEIIGYDKNLQLYTLQHYANNGDSGFMHGTIRDGYWGFWNNVQRFTGKFSEAGLVFSGIWEQLSNAGEWNPFIDMKLTRLTD